MFIAFLENPNETFTKKKQICKLAQKRFIAARQKYNLYTAQTIIAHIFPARRCHNILIYASLIAPSNARYVHATEWA